MPEDFDVIVIGSGAGGGTFAYACARTGKRVLLLERGERYTLKKPTHDERAMLIDKKPYDNRTVRLNGSPRHLYMGSVFGGGTALYGAALLRPSPDDFHPGKHYGQRLPRASWNWPISYEELEPYYSEAEELYGVSSPGDADFGPLPTPRNRRRHFGIPLKPINQTLIAANRARGLKPFRLPLAIDFTRCLQCPACPGYICPWRTRLLENSSTGRARYLLALTNVLVPLTLFRILLGWLLVVIAGRTQRLKAWHTVTLRDAMRAVHLVLENVDFRIRLGQAARRAVETWDWSIPSRAFGRSTKLQSRRSSPSDPEEPPASDLPD
jgi:choline dehydrogenase-like flavoprotein